VKKLALATVLAASAALASPAAANENEDWLDKANAFGIGSGLTLGSGAGLSLRFYPQEMFGLELVLGGNSSRTTAENVPSEGNPFPIKLVQRESEIAVSLLADFRFLLNNRSALSAFAGLGLVNYGVRDTRPQAFAGQVVATKVTDSFTDIVFGLGLRGEVFLYKFFSVHGRVGIELNPYGDADTEFAGTPEGIPDPPQPGQPVIPTVDQTEDGGIDVSFFDMSNVFGTFGFTFWFN